MIKVELEILPNALVEIVPGVAVSNSSGEKIKIKIKLDKVPVAGRSLPGAEPVNGVLTPDKLADS